MEVECEIVLVQPQHLRHVDPETGLKTSDSDFNFRYTLKILSLHARRTLTALLTAIELIFEKSEVENRPSPSDLATCTRQKDSSRIVRADALFDSTGLKQRQKTSRKMQQMNYLAIRADFIF